MSYNRTIQTLCGVDEKTARHIEAYLRLQYGTLDALSRERIVFEYENGGSEGSIKEAIQLDPDGAEQLAQDFGL